MAGRPAAELVAAVETLHEVTVELERRLRTLAGALTSGREIDPPFRAEIEETIARFSRRSGLPVELTGDGPLDELPADVRRTLVHVVAEALENVRRHSGASHVWIETQTADGDVRLEVRDDGSGFAAAESADGWGWPAWPSGCGATAAGSRSSRLPAEARPCGPGSPSSR